MLSHQTEGKESTKSIDLVRRVSHCAHFEIFKVRGSACRLPPMTLGGESDGNRISPRSARDDQRGHRERVPPTAGMPGRPRAARGRGSATTTPYRRHPRGTHHPLAKRRAKLMEPGARV